MPNNDCREDKDKYGADQGMKARIPPFFPFFLLARKTHDQIRPDHPRMRPPMSLTSVLESFNHHLPDIDRLQGLTSHARFRAPYSRWIQPLSLFWHDDVSELVGRAKSALSDPAVAEVLCWLFLPQQGPLQLQLQSDVPRCAAANLIYPVHLAICELLPEGVEINCKSKTWMGEAHLQFRWTLAYPTYKVPLAIIDILNKGVICWEDFKMARCKSPEHAEETADYMDNEDLDTMFRGNGREISKAAKRNSTTFDHIVFFDWDSMLAFDFSDHNPESTPEIVKMAHFSVVDPYIPVERDLNFRLLLLGVLIRALERHTEIERDRPGGREAHNSTNYNIPIPRATPDRRRPLRA